MNEPKHLAELLAAESAAKVEWEQAVQFVRAANDQVNRAHSKWLSAKNAVETARTEKQPSRAKAAASN
jgi:Ni,Fe-hydrogenase III large subunit